MKKILLAVLFGVAMGEAQAADLLTNSTAMSQRSAYSAMSPFIVATSIFTPFVTWAYCQNKDNFKRSLPYTPSLYGIAEDQGQRGSMEDAHVVEQTKDYHFFGVYDGHAGRRAADFSAKHLHEHFKRNFAVNRGKSRKFVANALRQSFLSTHDKFRKRHPNLLDGSCALTAVLYKDRLHIAHAGDSRAVLCFQGKVRQLSFDHKPEKPSEKVRLKAAGAVLVYDSGMEGFRIKSNDGLRGLAVSRSIGDGPYENLVIPDPDLTSVVLTKNDEFIILACDGVWDVFSNELAVKVTRNYFEEHPGDTHGAARHLKDQALRKGSGDNITVIVVDLASYVKGLAVEPIL